MKINSQKERYKGIAKKVLSRSSMIMDIKLQFQTSHQKIIIFSLLGMLLGITVVLAGDYISTSMTISDLSTKNVFALVLLLVFGVLVSSVILLSPKIGILGILIAVAIMPPVPQRIGLIEIFFSGLCLLVMFSWISRIIYTGKDLLLKSSLLKVLAIFMVICFLSYFKSFLNNVSFYSWTRSVLPFLMLLLSFVIAREFKNFKDIVLLISTFLFSSLLFSFQTWLPILKNFHSFLSPDPITEIRLELTPYAWQNFPLAGFAMSLGLIKHLRKSILKILLILIAIFFLLNILVTFSRSMILAVIVVLMVSFFLSDIRKSRIKRFRKAVVVTVILVLLSIFLIRFTPFSPLLSGFFNRFTALAEKEASPVAVRLVDYNVAFNNFLSQPIFGWGLGARFEYYRVGYRIFREVAYTHNILTYLLLYLGLVGFFYFLYFMFTLFRTLFKQRRKKILFIRAVADSLILGTIGVLFYAQFQSTYKSFTFNIFLAIVIGLAARMKILQDKIAREEEVEIDSLKRKNPSKR